MVMKRWRTGYRTVAASDEDRKGGTMGLTAAHDVAKITALGYSLRDAVREVARRALRDAERGASYSSLYLKEIHRLMVATA